MITSAKIVGSNIDYEVYSKRAPGVGRGHKDFIMSRSELTNFASNPKRWLDGYKDDYDDTMATIWGSLIDVMAMTPQKFEERYAVAPSEYLDDKTGKMKSWTFATNVCKAWREEQGDREILKADVYAEAQKAIAALHADVDVSELFKCSQKQVMVTGEWRDKETSILVPVRVLIDLVPDVTHPLWGKSLCDFKTARNGNPAIWARVVDDCGYDVQAALSTDLYASATKEDRTDWCFPLQENVKPYHVVKPMPALSAEFLAYGRVKYQQALGFYAHCLATNTWPSYPTGNRLVFGALQFVGPEQLYSYRESAGLGNRLTDFEPTPKPVKQTSDDDITP